MSYRHFAGKTSKADRQDLIDRINNTARNEFLHPASGVRKGLFVHRGRHAKPSLIVSPTRSIVALTLVVSSLCVTPAANADAVKSVVESKTASAYDSQSALDDSGKSDVEVTTSDSDIAGRSPESVDISSESSSSLRPQSLLKVSQTEGDASPTAVVPASGTWGTCRWDIDSDGVLTIHAGTGADSASTTGAPWYKWASDITAVRSDGTVFMPSTAVGLFYGCVNLTDISGLSKFDTSRLSNAHSMFRDCQKLTDLSPLSGWDMRSVENTAYMFTNVIELKSLSGLESWDMSKVGTVQGMFQGCNSLTDISAIKTWGLGSSGKLKILGWMFQDCWKLSDLGPLSNVDTGNATEFRGMFQNCVSITSTAPLSAWNTSNATMMGWMFFIESGTQSSIGKSSLTDISGLARWNVSKVTNFQSMFDTCSMLEDFSPLSSWRPDSAEIMGWMFTRCSKMRNLDFMSGWNITRIREMNAMFQGCSQLQDISPLQRWNVSRVQEMKWLFYGCHSLSSIEPLGTWKTDQLNNLYRTFSECRSLTDLSPLSGWDSSNLKILDWTFFGCGGLTNLDALSNWDTSNLQSLYRTFERCAGLTDVSGLSSWRTPNLKSMYYTFAYDQIADFTALKNWDVSKVTSMECLFESNKLISNADFTAGWDTSSLTNITQIFHLCHGMKDYKALANWKTGKITHMHGAFFQANMSNANMTYISNWDTSSLISIAQAFAGCPMTNLDALRNWNTDKLRGMGLAFWGCGNLTDTSALADWNLNSITSNDNPFTACDKLSIVGVPTVDHNGAWLLSRYTEVTGTKGWTAYDWAPVNRNLTSSQVKAGYTGSNTTITDVRVWRLGVKYWGTCPWWVDDEGILHINDVPGEGTGADVRVSQAGAPTPEDTAQIPWWAERRNIKGIATQSRVVMPESSTGLFMYMPNLTEVSGLSKWDASQVRDMDNMFRVDTSLQDLTGIEDWNVSQVEDMNCMFWGNKALTGIDPLAQWDTTSLTNTNFMFQGTIKLRSLRPLSSWKMGGVTTMICMFEGAISLVDLDGLEDWDVSNVTDMAGFVSSIAYATADNPNLNGYGASQLADISALDQWNVSNVQNFTAMFAGARITDTDALEHWDVHSGTTFKAMFTHCNKLADTSALASWKMDEDALAESSEPMSYMFRNCSSIVRAGVPAVGKGASYVAPAYPDRNWTDETLPITPLKDSNGIYPYMTSNDDDQEFTDNGGVFIPYQPVYIVTFDNNGATKPGALPDRQWAYVTPTDGQRGDVDLPVGYKGLRTGYHFAGWSTTPDASSGVISPDDATWRPSGGLSTGDPSKIVLYAVWEANTTSELPSTGSRGLLGLVFGFLGMIGLVVATGRTSRPRHAR